MAKLVLTTAMKKAGIVKVGDENLNGSYQCYVNISNIDVACSRTNFRKWDPKHTAELDRDFYDKAMRNPMLMYMPRRLTIPSIEGRHTIQLLHLINRRAVENGIKPPYTLIPCDVFFGITQNEAAKIFYYLTQRSKRMDPWSAFYAALQGKFQFALEISQLIKEFGFTSPVDDGIPPKRGADITSVEPLTDAWNIGGENLVRHLLMLLRAFVDREGYLDKEAGKSAFMRGLLDILRDGSYMPIQWATWLGRHDAQFFKALACSVANREKRRLERRHYKMAFLSVIPAKQRLAA